MGATMDREERERQFARELEPMGRSWRHLADAALAELGVSNSTSWCLVYLDRMGPNVRQTDLAHAVGVTQPSLVALLNQLEAAGLIGRSPDPDDGRAKQLRLTPEGRARLARIEERLIPLRRNLLADISDAEIDAVLAVLARISVRMAAQRASGRGLPREVA